MHQTNNGVISAVIFFSTSNFQTTVLYSQTSVTRGIRGTILDFEEKTRIREVRVLERSTKFRRENGTITRAVFSKRKSLFPVIEIGTPPPTSHRDRLAIMNPEMIAHLNEWLEQCDTLQSSHIMTDEEIIEYIVKGKENPIVDETADSAAMENEDEGIEFIGILKEVPEREKSSHEELIDHLSWSLEQLSLRKWFDHKDVLAVVSLVERARRDFYNSKTKQTKLTSFFGSCTS